MQPTDVCGGANGRQLLEAAERGDRARVAALLCMWPAGVATRDGDGQTPLHRAAAAGRHAVMALLLERGGDADARDDRGRTPLHGMVLWRPQREVAELLLAHGASLNARDREGSTPLTLAAGCIHRPPFGWADHAGLAAYLLARGAELDIFTAVILDHTAGVRALLRGAPALVHSRDSGVRSLPAGATPLHHAAERGHTEVARALLAAGADVSARDSRGRTPLYLAAQGASGRRMRLSPEMADLLIAYGAPHDIFAAALLGHVDHVRRLLDGQPTLVRAADAGGSTPLHVAAWTGQWEAVQLLAQRGAALNARDARGETPLAAAALYSYDERVRATLGVLLSYGAEWGMAVPCRGATRATDTLLTSHPLRDARDQDPHAMGALQWRGAVA